MKDYYIVKLNRLFVSNCTLENMENPFDVIQLVGAKQFAHKFDSETMARDLANRISGQVIMVKQTVQEKEMYIN